VVMVSPPLEWYNVVLYFFFFWCEIFGLFSLQVCVSTYIEVGFEKKKIKKKRKKKPELV